MHEFPTPANAADAKIKSMAPFLPELLSYLLCEIYLSSNQVKVKH